MPESLCSRWQDHLEAVPSTSFHVDDRDAAVADASRRVSRCRASPDETAGPVFLRMSVRAFHCCPAHRTQEPKFLDLVDIFPQTGVDLVGVENTVHYQYRQVKLFQIGENIQALDLGKGHCKDKEHIKQPTGRKRPVGPFENGLQLNHRCSVNSEAEREQAISGRLSRIMLFPPSASPPSPSICAIIQSWTMIIQ